MTAIKVQQIDATHWRIIPQGDAVGWVVSGKSKDDAINAFTSWSVYNEVYEVSE